MATTETNIEPLAVCHQIDQAVRNKAAKQPTGTDVIVLAMHGIEGAEFKAEGERLAGVDHSLSITGTPEEFSQAQARAEKAAEALEAGKAKLSPIIAKLQAQLDQHTATLRALRDEERSACDDLTRRQARRRMLQTKLLPPLLQQLVATEEQPIRDKFAPTLADARRALSMATTRAASGIGGGTGVGALEQAEADLKNLERQLDAELMECAPEIRNFYLGD